MGHWHEKSKEANSHLEVHYLKIAPENFENLCM